MIVEQVHVEEPVSVNFDSLRPPSSFKTAIVSRQVDIIADESKTNDTLYNILRPALTVLRVFGLIHNVDWVRSRQASKPPWTVSKMYNVVVLVILWQNPVRLFAIYEAGDFSTLQASSFMKAIIHLWLLLCALNGTCMFYVFHNKDMIKKLFSLYEHVSCHYDCGSQKLLRRRMIITVIATLIFSGTFILSFVCALFCGIPQIYELFTNALAPFQTSDWIKGNVPMKLLFVVVFSFASAASLLPMMLFFVLCFLIIGMEKSFTSFVETHMTADGTLDCSIFKLRMHYLRICDIIESANNVFQNFIGFNLVIYVANTGLVIWALVSSNVFVTNPFIAVNLMYWTFTNILQLFILSYGPGMVNDKIYDFAGYIYHLRSVNIEKGDDVQINLLLAKIDGPAIGFSAFDLFIVDKPSIMAVFGMIFSYLLLMVDMSSNSAPGANSTCVQGSLNASLINTTST